mgnify:CR=1 FL=1
MPPCLRVARVSSSDRRVVCVVIMSWSFPLWSGRAFICFPSKSQKMETFIASEYFSWHFNVVVDPSLIVTFVCEAFRFNTGRKNFFFTHEPYIDMISSDRCDGRHCEKKRKTCKTCTWLLSIWMMITILLIIAFRKATKVYYHIDGLCTRRHIRELKQTRRRRKLERHLKM